MVADAEIDWRFETPRIRARLIEACDRDLYRNLYTDPAVMAHICATKSEAEADAVFEKVLDYNKEIPMRARYWQLSDIASGERVGLLSSLRAAGDPGLVELGIMLLPHWQGRRIGPELSEGIMDFLMENRWGLNTHTVVARNASTNIRVGCMTAKLGFRAMKSGSDLQEARCLTQREWLAAHGR